MMVQLLVEPQPKSNAVTGTVTAVETAVMVPLSWESEVIECRRDAGVGDVSRIAAAQVGRRNGQVAVVLEVRVDVRRALHGFFKVGGVDDGIVVVVGAVHCVVANVQTRNVGWIVLDLPHMVRWGVDGSEVRWLMHGVGTVAGAAEAIPTTVVHHLHRLHALAGAVAESVAADVVAVLRVGLSSVWKLSRKVGPVHAAWRLGGQPQALVWSIDMETRETVSGQDWVGLCGTVLVGRSDGSRMVVVIAWLSMSVKMRWRHVVNAALR